MSTCTSIGRGSASLQRCVPATYTDASTMLESRLVRKKNQGPINKITMANTALPRLDPFSQPAHEITVSRRVQLCFLSVVSLPLQSSLFYTSPTPCTLTLLASFPSIRPMNGTTTSCMCLFSLKYTSHTCAFGPLCKLEKIFMY
jgi:hypothetical protein